MGASHLEVEFDDRELLKVIDDYASRGKNLAPVMKLIALDLADRVEDNFANQGGFKQGAWAPLSPYTLRRRRKQGRGAKILQDTGVLASSVVTDSGENFAELFTTLFYAKYHTSKAPRHKIPLRDFLDVDIEGAQRHAAEMILDEII